MKSQLNVVIVGHGAIARYVIEEILPINRICITALICRETSRDVAFKLASQRFAVLTTVDELDSKPDLLVDCAGHSGLKCHALAALEKGINVISISTGALADASFMEELERSAKTGNSTIRFLSGAVGGIDALTAASAGDIKQIVYTGRKPPSGWSGSPAQDLCDLKALSEPFQHFEGSAREAARRYPKNANVAATIALASVGLDNVIVKLIADPAVDNNIHEIEAIGSFGRLKVQVEAKPLPSNPKSSALAAMSIVAELKRHIKRIAI